jgi:hypothetical protein
VWPTVKAVESAISEVSEKLTDSMTINVANGQQRGSWPMCMLHYLAVRSNASTSDCLGINSLLYFTAWTQLTPMAVTKSRELGYAPLSLSFKAYLFHFDTRTHARTHARTHTHTHTQDTHDRVTYPVALLPGN